MNSNDNQINPINLPTSEDQKLSTNQNFSTTDNEISFPISFEMNVVHPIDDTHQLTKEMEVNMNFRAVIEPFDAEHNCLACYIDGKCIGKLIPGSNGLIKASD